jgi:hypothetical protein
MKVARRNRWPSVAALSLGVGFAFWLMSGDPRIAAVTALAAALFAALWSAGRDRSNECYSFAAAAVVMAFVMTRCGSRRSGPDAWQDLAREYGSSAAATGGIGWRGDIHLVRHTGDFMVQRFRYRRARVMFDRGQVFLRLSWPQTLVYDSLRVPARRLTSCQTGEGEDYGKAVLRILHPPVDLAVGDPGDRILGWCREHGIKK